MRFHLPWPLPALLAWLAGWLLWLCVPPLGVPMPAALALAFAAGGAAALACRGTLRRIIAAAGFPLSLLASGGASGGAIGGVSGGAAGLPGWVWLLPLLPLLALYPLRAWRDAPLFPTPHDALIGLDAVVGRPQHALDAGCGLGHGLAAMRRLWPEAMLSGIEWSAPLAWAAARRCRNARVQRGDMWAASWAGHDLVYLFQRPESMARAFAKAAQELSPQAWLVSLEFEVPGVVPAACLQGPGRKPLWLYRPAAAAAHSTGPAAGR